VGYGAEPVSEKEKKKEKQNQRDKQTSLFLSRSDLSHKQLGVAGAAERDQQQSMQNSKSSA
jgi:hypothetical protein